MKTIVTISHTDYTKSVGGTEKVILEQSRLFRSAGFNILHFCPVSKAIKIKKRTAFSYRVGYKVLNNDQLVESCCSFKNVLKYIQKEDVHRIIIHMLTGVSVKDVEVLFDKFPNVKKYFYVHDYKTVCPSQVLLKNKNYYCGDNGRHFTKCFSCRFYWEGFLSYSSYRKFFLSNQNLFFVFPSEIARDIWKKTYPTISQERLFVISHQILTGELQRPQHMNTKLRIAYVGYKSFNKGWSCFKRMVLSDCGDKYDYFILGKTDESLPGVSVAKVSFIDDGPDAMINALKEHKIDIALLWSTWPETYSYTFYESYVAGSFILTNKNSGNISAMVEKFNCGKVLNTEKDLTDYLNSNNLIKDLNEDFKQRPSQLEINERGMCSLIQ